MGFKGILLHMKLEGCSQMLSKQKQCIVGRWAGVFNEHGVAIL